MDDLYPCWTDESTVVIAHKRGVFGSSQAAANKWAKESFPRIYQTLHTVRYFAWRVDRQEKYPQPKGSK